MIKEHLEDCRLIFHAPLISDVNDVISGLQGVNVDGTWDAYASTRGIKVSSVRYKSNVYWNISSLRQILSLAKTIIIRADYYVLGFAYAIPNANNYANLALIDDPTSYTTSNKYFNLITAYGNGSAVAFTSLNTQNTMQLTWDDITTTSHNRLVENLTQETSFSDSSSTSLLRQRISECDYLNFFYRVNSGGGTYNGYLKDLKIWVKL